MAQGDWYSTHGPCAKQRSTWTFIPEYKMLSFFSKEKIIENNNSLVVISFSKVGEKEFLQTY